MRITSLGPGVVSLGATAAPTAVPALSPSPKNKPVDKALSKLVERRVRASLSLVKRGEATPAQALQAVVWHLAQELPEPAFASLLTYFQAKQAQGALAPAKQLLLRCLRAAQHGATHNPGRAPQPARKQPLRDQQQPPAQQALQAAQQQANKAAGAFQGFLRASSSFNNLTTVTGSKVAGPPIQLFLSPADQAANSSLQQTDAPRTKQQQQQPAVAALGCSNKAASWFSSHNCALQLDV